jgi:AraC-like DNA-binding protein
MSGRSQFHYRYVVHLRLRSAVELVREGKLPLAEIAAATGFADQSQVPLGETGARRIDDPADNPAGGVGAAPRDWPRRHLGG